MDLRMVDEVLAKIVHFNKHIQSLEKMKFLILFMLLLLLWQQSASLSILLRTWKKTEADDKLRLLELAKNKHKIITKHAKII